MPTCRFVHTKKRLISVFCILAFVVFFTAYLPFTYAENGVPATIAYQGHLADSAGNNLGGAGTPYYFKFSFWDSSTVGSGNKLWPVSGPSPVSLTVKQGAFNVNIGDTDNGYPDILNYNFNTNKKIYLQVEVSGDNTNFETLSPRSSITSYPFAQVAGQVNGVGQSSFGTVTPLANSVITSQSVGTNSTALSILGYSGQSANLLNVFDSANNPLFSIGANGNITTSGNLTANGNILASSSLFVSGAVNFYNTLNTTGLATFSSGFSLNNNTFTNLLGTGLSNVSGTLTNSGVTSILGTTNQVSVSNATGTITLSLPQSISTTATPTFASTTLSNFTSGSIPFFSTGGSLSQNNANIYWDNINGRLGVGTSSPASRLDVYGVAGSSDIFSVSSSTGSRLFTVNSSGNLGIGTTTPNMRLSLWGAGVNGYFGISSTTQGDIFKIDTVGKVGIGSTTPYSTLSVSGTAGTNPFTIASSTGSTLLNVLQNGNVGVGISAPLAALHIYGTMGSGSDGADITGIRLTNIQGLTWRISSGIGGVLHSSFNISNPGGASLFNINGTNGTVGNVGIGSTTPQAKLTVTGTSGSTNDLFVVSSSTNDVLFNIKSGGNVGIGTASPGQKLDVAGNINTSGNYSIGNTSVVYKNGNDYAFRAPGGNLLFLGNSAEYGRFTTSGLFGIGTSSPSAKLSIHDSSGLAGTNPLFIIASSSASGTGTTTLLTVLGNGNVGINKANPSVALDVTGAITASGNITGNILYGQVRGTYYTSGGATEGWGHYSNGVMNITDTNGSITPTLLLSTTVIGTTTPYAKLSVQGTYGDTRPLFDIASTTSSGFATSSLFTVVANGNVGVGIATPTNKFQVAGATFLNGTLTIGSGNKIQLDSGTANRASIRTSNAGTQDIVFETASNDRMIIGASGNVGLGTTTPWAKLSVQGTYGSATPLFDIASTTSSSFATSSLFTIKADGSMKIGGFGIGTLNSDSSGNITVSSDERLKDISGKYNRGLSDLLAISPILYKWKSTTGYDTVNTYAGFSAQNVQQSIPEAVGIDGKGMLTLSDRPILATLVNAVKELNTNTKTITTDYVNQAIVQAIASSSDAISSTTDTFIKNSITSFLSSITDWVGEKVTVTFGYFKEIFADKVTTKELCLEDVCVTKDQLKTLLSTTATTTTTTISTNISSSSLSSLSIPVVINTPIPTPVIITSTTTSAEISTSTTIEIISTSTVPIEPTSTPILISTPTPQSTPVESIAPTEPEIPPAIESSSTIDQQ